MADCPGGGSCTSTNTNDDGTLQLTAHFDPISNNLQVAFNNIVATHDKLKTDASSVSVFEPLITYGSFLYNLVKIVPENTNGFASEKQLQLYDEAIRNRPLPQANMVIALASHLRSPHGNLTAKQKFFNFLQSVFIDAFNHLDKALKNYENRSSDKELLEASYYTKIVSNRLHDCLSSHATGNTEPSDIYPELRVLFQRMNAMIDKVYSDD